MLGWANLHQDSGLESPNAWEGRCVVIYWHRVVELFRDRQFGEHESRAQREVSKRVFDIFDTTIQQLLKENNFLVDGDKPNPKMCANLQSAEMDEDVRDELF